MVIFYYWPIVLQRSDIFLMVQMTGSSALILKIVVVIITARPCERARGRSLCDSFRSLTTPLPPSKDSPLVDRRLPQ